MVIDNYQANMVYNFRNEENTGPIEELELEINLL